jgi:hypothetical protein
MSLNGTARVLKSFGSEVSISMHAGGASIVLVPADSGKLFIPRAAFLRIIGKTGSGSDGTIKIHCGATNIVPITTIPSASSAVGDLIELALLPANASATSRLVQLDIGSQAINVSVGTAAGLTSYTARVYLEGYKL